MISHLTAYCLARPAGFEPTTPWFVGISHQIVVFINQALATFATSSFDLLQSQQWHIQSDKDSPIYLGLSSAMISTKSAQACGGGATTLWIIEGTAAVEAVSDVGLADVIMKDLSVGSSGLPPVDIT